MVFYRLEDSLKAILTTESQRKAETPVNDAYTYLNSLDIDMWWQHDLPWDRARFSYDLHHRYREVAGLVATHYGACPRPHASQMQHLRATYAEGRCPPAQAALYVQLRARMMLAFLACECALDLLEGDDDRRDAFRRRRDLAVRRESPEFADLSPNFTSAVAKLVRDRELARGLPVFLQSWLYGWGAYVNEAARNEEMEAIAAEIGETRDAVAEYLDFLGDLYSTLAGDMIQRVALGRKGILSFNLVPEPFKGIGVRRRIAEGLVRREDLPAYQYRWLDWPERYARNLPAADDGGGFAWEDLEP